MIYKMEEWAAETYDELEEATKDMMTDHFYKGFWVGDKQYTSVKVFIPIEPTPSGEQE